MTSAPHAAVQDYSPLPTQPPLTSLVFLATTIDMKQTKLELACTVAHQAQLRAQLSDLIGRFQKQYADWLKSGNGEA